MDALKSKSCVPFSQVCVFTFIARRYRKSSCLPFLHSFNAGCYHHSTIEIML